MAIRAGKSRGAGRRHSLLPMTPLMKWYFRVWLERPTYSVTGWTITVFSSS